MPIDFSRINLSRGGALPKGGNVVKTPSRVKKAPLGGRIDYGAIKLSNIYTRTKAAPRRHQIPAPTVVRSSTPFIGRPFVTPVEQQRMKAAKPTPPAVSRLTGKYDPQKYNPEVNPVAPLLQTEAVKRWSAEAAAARKATPEIGQRLFEGMDSFTKIIQPNITPREPGRNTVVDFVGSIATVAAGVYAAKSLLSALGAGVLYLKTPRSVVDRETTTLFPRFDDSFHAQKYVLRLSQSDPASAEKYKGDLTTLLAQTMAKDMPTTLSDESLQKSASLMYDFLVSNGQAGSFATVGERVASVATAASNLAAAVGNPRMSLVVAERAANQLAKTGMLQLLPPLAVANRLGTVPMPAGLVHSTAPAIPMGGAVDVPMEPVSVATEPYVSRDKFQVEHPLLERPQPAVPGVQTTKSMDTIMAEEEAAGRKLETTPRAVDKTIPAIDVKKANLVDVTAKVDLPSVQVKFPSADKVVLDTKRRTVMFMHGATPLEAIAVDKPQLKDWYGIEGAKLLEGITRPVVAQVAPTAPPLSKMETPAAQPIQAFPELQPLLEEARKYKSAVEFAGAIENPTNLTTKGLPIGHKNLPVGGWLIDTVLDRQGGKMYRIKMPDGKTTVIPVDQTKVITGWGNGLADFYDKFVGKPASVTPDLSTTPQKGPSAAISNQKTGISTSTPVSPRGGTATGAGQPETVKWGKWKKAGTAEYQLVNELTQIRQWGKTDFQPPTFGKPLQFKGDTHSYFLVRESAVPAKGGFSALPASYHVVEAKSGNAVSIEATEAEAVATARRALDGYGQTTDDRITELVALHGGEANPASVPSALITSTSAPAGASPAIGNATPAHGLIDYSRIELNGPSVPAHVGTTSQTSQSVLASVSNTGKGFDNYVQNTAGTTNVALSHFAKFKEWRDFQVRRFINRFDGLMKTPLGAEWMTMAISADEVLRQEYARPFYVDEAGERVFVEGGFGPKILERYLKQYGPNFGKFLQHLQRAGIPIEATNGLGMDKKNLAQQHIMDARMNLVNFQKNEPQLFTAYMAAADELGNANALLAEFYKGIISPETYAKDKASPHYYLSLSAGKTDVFDRSGVAPLERAHGLTNLDEVVPPLEGLKAVYVDAIRAQGINNAKREAVRANKNSEVATTVLSDSIVHLKENGVDRAYNVHDKNVMRSVRNLTLESPEVSTLEKRLVRAPTTMIRLFATGLNPAFGLFNIIRDTIQMTGLVPFTPTGLVKGVVRAVKSPGLSQWFDSYRDPTASKEAGAMAILKTIVETLSLPNEVTEASSRSVVLESIANRGGTYLEQLYGYFASTGFFALHGTFFNDFIASTIPFTRATIAVIRSAYRNTFYGLPIGGKGGTFSGKQGAEKMAGRTLATIVFAIIGITAIKAAGKEKEYKLLRNRASYFYFPTSKAWIKFPVPIGFVPVKAGIESLFGYESDPIGVVKQTANVIPGLDAFFLTPFISLTLQFVLNRNFFTGADIVTRGGTPAANVLEEGLMKLGLKEEQAVFLLRSLVADIPSQVQYVFDTLSRGASTQTNPLTRRFIVKDPTLSSNAATDDFYTLVRAANMSGNDVLKRYVNGQANFVSKNFAAAKADPKNIKKYYEGITDRIILVFAYLAQHPELLTTPTVGQFSFRKGSNYEELAP